MKNNRIIKTIIMIAIIAVMCFIGTTVNASSISDIYSGQSSVLMSQGGKIIYVVQTICYAAAVIILIVKGVKFMQAAPEAKAEVKKEMIAYSFGSILLFAAGTIVKIVGEISMNNVK